MLLYAVFIFKRSTSFVFMIELITIAEGLEVTKVYGSSRVVLESNSKGTIDIVLSCESYFNEFRSILVEISLSPLRIYEYNF